MRQQRRWTDDEVQSLMSMAAKGMSTKEIARALGRTPASVASKAKALNVKRGRALSAIATMALKLLQEAPMDPRELAERLSIRRSNVYMHVNALRKRGLIREFDWIRNPQGPPAPIWTAQPGKRAPKPRPMTGREAYQRYITRMKAQDPIKYHAYMNRKNARRRKPGRADIAASWIKEDIQC